MRWEDERYVRVYTRDTVDWLALSFHAKALWLMLLRKADRAGIITIGKRGKAAIAVLMGHPEMAAELLPAFEELLADGCCELSPDGTQLVIPNFLEAQEATKSPNERQREYRLRARDAARAGLPPASQKGCSIYFIQSEHGGPVKVGRADDLAKRLVGLQTGRPDKLVVIAAAPGTRENESAMHRLLAPWRERGEWFSPSAPVMAAAALVNERGADSWSQMGDVISRVLCDGSSPRTSPVASPVTPSRAVPSLAVPFSASQGSADAGQPADDLPDATDDAHPDESQMTQMAANGCPDCTPIVACWKHLERPVPGAKPEKPPRTPSKAQAVYAKIQDERRRRCEDAGEPFVEDRWDVPRINRDIGGVAKEGEEATARFLLAWDAFLADDTRASNGWSLSYFMKGSVRSMYETRGLKAGAA